MSDELITTQQAAAELGVSDSRVRQLIIGGELPAQRFGRSHMIKKSDLKDVIIGNRGRPRKDAISSQTGKAKPKKGKSQ